MKVCAILFVACVAVRASAETVCGMDKAAFESTAPLNPFRAYTICNQHLSTIGFNLKTSEHALNMQMLMPNVDPKYIARLQAEIKRLKEELPEAEEKCFEMAAKAGRPVFPNPCYY